MGFFSRWRGAAADATAVGVGLAIGEVWSDSGAFERADEIARSGATDEAVVTGLRVRDADGRTDTWVRVEWLAPQPSIAAVKWLGSPSPMVRLGATLRVARSGADTVFDLDGMAGSPSADYLPQRPGLVTSSVPDHGVDDTALDVRVRRRLLRWTGGSRATIESVTRRMMLGLPTETFDLALRTDTGVVRVSHEVPAYARMVTAPGADVPVRLDPRDPSSVQVDWVALALERARVGGTWRDVVPPGSVAALIGPPRLPVDSD